MPKILFISGLQIYPPGSGGQLRSSGLVATLAAAGFTVEIYSLVGRKPDYLAGKPSEMVAVGPNIHEYIDRTRWLAALQLIAYRLNLPPLFLTWILRLWRPRVLRGMLQTAQAVIVDFPFLYPAARGCTAPCYLSTHNIEADLITQPLWRWLVARTERRAAKAVDGVICCSAPDRAFFSQLVGAERTLLIPNGIDMARFADLAPSRAAARQQIGVDAATQVLLFAASSFGPNVEGLDFLRSFAAAHAEWLRQERLHILAVGSVSKTPESLPGLTVTGPVAAVEPYFAAADWALNIVFRGSGTNVKMGEYMAAGLPILTTEVGSRGYHLVDKQDFLLVSQEDFAAVLRTFVAGSASKDRQAMAASAFAKNASVISMTQAVQPLLRLLRGAAAGHA